MRPDRHRPARDLAAAGYAPAGFAPAGLVLMLVLASGAAFAGAYEDAVKLKREAQKLLAVAMDADEVDPARSKKIIEKLEAARKLLEPFAFDGGAKKERGLIEELNHLIYWTRKTSPIQVEPPPPPDPISGEEAARLWKELREYEKTRADEPVLLCARFFEAAERLRGTDGAKAAMLKAQKYQRAAAKVIARQRKVTSRVDELAKEGDGLREAGNLDEAAAAYAKALEAEPLAGLAKRLGSTYFLLASKLRAEYSRIYKEAREEYVAAAFRSDRDAIKKAARKAKDASKISTESLAYYARSREAYEKAVELSPKKREIESEVYIALTWAVIPKPEPRAKAVAALELIVRDREPVTIQEKMVYEYARNELSAIKAAAKEEE